ncbi:molybdenum cofactor biosynthesis protein MoaE [Bdellovibrionota bacterium FG-2]
MGRITVKVSDEAIDANRLQALLASVSNPAHGASVLFLGIVRNFHDGREVLAVSYDAHLGLSEKIFGEICQESVANAHAKWDEDLDLVLVHRVGKLAVGEASVGIAVGSAHREAAFEASRYLIEQLKIRAPIWKLEHYKEGESQWLKGVRL